MSSSTKNQGNFDENGLKKGPWTVEEDTLLIHSIALHGEGRWNLLALRSGLRRTGKSCRLRWLNYLKPEVKRGNLSPQEQILILDLHLRWGNRWSKIAQELPGRTDNEIKNYWRTRVQKQAKLLNIDTNTPQFKDIVRCFWIPRLLQQINESPSSTISQVPAGEKDCHFSSEKKQENLDPDQSSCISQISSESMDISGGYIDPFSGDPFLSVPPPPEFDYSMTGWMDNYSDAGYVWNFDELWQF